MVSPLWLIPNKVLLFQQDFPDPFLQQSRVPQRASKASEGSGKCCKTVLAASDLGNKEASLAAFSKTWMRSRRSLWENVPWPEETKKEMKPEPRPGSNRTPVGWFEEGAEMKEMPSHLGKKRANVTQPGRAIIGGITSKRSKSMNIHGPGLL